MNTKIKKTTLPADHWDRPPGRFRRIMRRFFGIPEKTPGALPMRFHCQPGDYTWEDWHEEMKGKYPVRHFLSQDLPVVWGRFWNRAWVDPMYWLRTHTIRRYHIIDIRNKKNGYRWGWLDRGEALLFASFAVFTEFMEREFPGHVDWDHEEGIRLVKAEFLILHEWWKTGRKAEHDAHDAKTHRLYGKKREEVGETEREKHHQEGEALEKKDDEMLLRLMAVRRYLWT